MAVPIIAIVGNSKSGKTTLIEKLIPVLKRRGYLVGSIKHAREIDIKIDKDSDHHLEAGSETTILASSEQIVMFKPTTEPTTDEIRHLFYPDLDLILCEGFKHTDLPKIQVYRKGCGELIEGLTSVLAIVSEEKVDLKVRQFTPDDVESIADLLEKGFIQPQKEWLDLYVNGKQVPLTLFPRQIINDVIMAMVMTLKEIEPVKTLEIKMKQR